LRKDVCRSDGGIKRVGLNRGAARQLANLRVGPPYVSALSAFFSYRIVLSGNSASFSVCLLKIRHFRKTT
jgi:hypothetical protein